MIDISEVTLTGCQQRAYDTILSNDKHVTLSGPAGSGKTFLTSLLIQAFEQAGKTVALVAPTHQAKNVLRNQTGYDVVTIHSLFKIHPDTYEDQRSFAQSGEVELDDIDILIIDEASMVDDDLFDIIGSHIPRYCRVIGLGDKYQIQPVRHEPGHLSPMFTRFDVVEMEEVVRQAADNPIIQVATDIRNGGWFSTNWSKERKQGVMHVPNISRMMDAYFSKIKTPDDLMDYRILAYTNNCVDEFNSIVRSEVYKTDDPFIVGEYIVTQVPVMQNDGKYMQCVIENGGVVKILDIEQTEFVAKLPRVPDETFDVAKLTVQHEEGVYVFMVMWNDANKERFKEYLNVAAQSYKSHAGNTRLLWKAFWSLKDSIIDTKSLSASTTHKSQGSTVKGCFIYTQDFSFAEPEIIQQLAYVGVTRPTDFCLYN